MNNTNSWKMRDGTVISISDMKDSHLISTINMLKRKGMDKGISMHDYFLCPAPQGDMAQLAWEHELDAVFERPCRKHPAYEYLVKEAKKRKLL